MGAANLVTNPGFETGAFTGWTVVNHSTSGVAGYSGDGTQDLNPFLGVAAASYGYPANSGNDYAYFGVGGTTVTLSQLISTTAGGGYTVTFDLANDYSSDPTHGYINSVAGSFGAAAPLTLSNVIGTEDGNGNETYTQYKFYGLATSASTSLTFNFQNDAGQFSLDDVSVVSGTPEPSSWSLALTALGAVIFAARRRRSRTDKGESL
jgi:MYXO-CTERM domain-containing protein